MMFNQPNMQMPPQQVVQQPTTNVWANGQNGFNQPQQPTTNAWTNGQNGFYQYTPNWNRPVMTNQTVMPNQFNGTLPGKVINNLQEVRPNEVPMDGSASIFPMNDFSSIYVKAWGPDGNIQTLKFIPDVTTNKEVADQGPSEFDKIMERLDSIEKKLAESGPRPQKSSYSSQKKEVSTNAE